MTGVLFLCTGNLCRSPSAEWFLTKRLAETGPDDVTVESAGTLGTSSPLPASLVSEGADFGLDLSGHLPRQMDAGMIGRADLVIGMSREHVREVVLADTSSFPKTFTMRELIRRGREVGPRGPEQSVPDWLEQVGTGRRHLELIGDSPIDDIPDPMGGTAEDFRLMLMELTTLTRTLHELVWP